MGNYTGKTWQMKNYKKILKKIIEGKTSSKTWEIVSRTRQVAKALAS